MLAFKSLFIHLVLQVHGLLFGVHWNSTAKIVCMLVTHASASLRRSEVHMYTVHTSISLWPDLVVNTFNLAVCIEQQHNRSIRTAVIWVLNKKGCTSPSRKVKRTKCLVCCNDKTNNDKSKTTKRKGNSTKWFAIRLVWQWRCGLPNERREQLNVQSNSITWCQRANLKKKRKKTNVNARSREDWNYKSKKRFFKD